MKTAQHYQYICNHARIVMPELSEKEIVEQAVGKSGLQGR